MTPAQRIDVVEEAKTWLGTPWRHMQRVKGLGVDCANLPAAVYEACGLIDHVEAEYPRQWMLHRKEDRFVEWIVRAGGVEIAREGLQPGDLIVWKFGLCFSHSGFLIEGTTILHAYVNVGVCYGDMARDTDLSEREARYFTIGGES